MDLEKGIIEIFGEVVKEASQDCTIINAAGEEVTLTGLDYRFGNSDYIKEVLDEYSKSADTMPLQNPLVALFVPMKEERGTSRDVQSYATANVIIACSTTKDWSNEERLQYSFQNILRPIYRSLLAAMRKHPRLATPYDGEISHTYSENYSYGRFGAYTESGDSVSEPIDAIDIRQLQITLLKPNCRNK